MFLEMTFLFVFATHYTLLFKQVGAHLKGAQQNSFILYILFLGSGNGSIGMVWGLGIALP